MNSENGIASLYQYLNDTLDDTATTEDIIRAKRVYKKEYNSDLKKRRRSEMKQLTLTIPINVWSSLQVQANLEEEDVYFYIKTCLEFLGSNESPLLLNKVRFLLAELKEYLPAVIESKLFDTKPFQTQLNRIEESLEKYNVYRKQFI